MCNLKAQDQTGLLIPAVPLMGLGPREKPHGKGVVNAALPVELRTPEHKEITMGSKHQGLKWRPPYFVNADSRDCWNLNTEKARREKTFTPAHVDTTECLLFRGLSYSSHSTLYKINTKLPSLTWALTEVLCHLSSWKGSKHKFNKNNRILKIYWNQITNTQTQWLNR